MPILLDTPLSYDPGHGQPTHSYPEVKIIDVGIAIEDHVLRLRTQYGETINDVWIPGVVPSVDHVITDTPAHLGPGGVEVEEDLAFSTMAATTVTQGPAGSNLYAEVAGAFYALLISQGLYSGTIQ